MSFTYKNITLLQLSIGKECQYKQCNPTLSYTLRFLIVVLFWTVIGSAGALPFLIADNPNVSVTDAFFESFSALTTTGATVIVGLDDLPKAILFYVSFFIQFIDFNYQHTWISYAILAAILEVFSFTYLTVLIFLGTFLTQYMRNNPSLGKVGNGILGMLFMGFAARLATLT